jgi:hypothetical protein
MPPLFAAVGLSATIASVEDELQGAPSLFSKTGQCVDIIKAQEPIGPGAFDLDGKRRIIATPNGSVQTIDQRVKLGRVQIFQSTEVGDNPVADLSLFVAIALDQLKVLAPTGFRDFRIHVATICAECRYFNDSKLRNVPQQRNRKNPDCAHQKPIFY